MRRRTGATCSGRMGKSRSSGSARGRAVSPASSSSSTSGSMVMALVSTCAEAAMAAAMMSPCVWSACTRASISPSRNWLRYRMPVSSTSSAARLSTMMRRVRERNTIESIARPSEPHARRRLERACPPEKSGGTTRNSAPRRVATFAPPFASPFMPLPGSGASPSSRASPSTRTSSSVAPARAAASLPGAARSSSAMRSSAMGRLSCCAHVQAARPARLRAGAGPPQSSRKR